MSPTLDQITAYENRLRAEVVERECILAALKVLRTYADNGHTPEGLELLPLAARLLTPVQEVPTLPAALPSPAPVTVTPPTPPPFKRDPELEKLWRRHGGDTAVVKWAIARMTDDYSLTDIARLLEREGGFMRFNAKISVVLTRLKSRGEIEEVKRGFGPHPAVFRKPENPIPLVKEAADAAGEAESSPGDAAAA